MRRKISLILVLLINGCGSESNPYTYLTPKSHLEVFDVQLRLGQSALDEGDVLSAKEHAELAYRLNPYSEQAAVLLGYVNLTLVGISPFALVKKLSEKDSSSSSTATDGFSKFANLFGFTNEDYLALGTSNALDPSLIVIEPYCANSVRESDSKLALINKAITAICPFVDADIHLADDYRHNCAIIAAEKRSSRAQSHFLWAFAHLYEALDFHGVLQYKTADANKTNLELRLAKLQTFSSSDPSKLADFILQTIDFSNLTAKILQVSRASCSGLNPETQLYGLVYDLLSVSLAFSKMPGIPKEIVAKVSALTTDLNSINKVSDESKDLQAKSTKAQLTGKMAQGLSTAISSINPNDLAQEDKSKLCAAYSEISGKDAKVDAALPAICK